MSAPLTRTELDRAQCQSPDCTEKHGPLYIHSRCHTEAAVQATYEDGLLTITCADCGKLVTKIAVAESKVQ